MSESSLSCGPHGILINSGALGAYSYAITHALAGTGLPGIEVHILNVQAREEWRRRSVLSPVVVGDLGRLGWHGYIFAVQGLLAYSTADWTSLESRKDGGTGLQITPLSRNLSRSPRDI